MINVIKCPKCGYEYVPTEIFFPDALLGNPTQIQRNSEGKIEDYMGLPPNPIETWECDKCGATFTVISDLKFKVKLLAAPDIKTPHVTKIYGDRIVLPEN